jgi:hypothetical protein
MRNLLLVVVFCGFLPCFGQENESWKLFPGGADTSKTKPETDKKIRNFDLNFNDKKGEVKVVKDDRIQALTEFVGTPQKSDPGVKIKGFRVQIFFDSDKDLVNQKRSDYLAQHRENPAYVDYLAPNFRLRVGNFRTRLQAQEWEHELLTTFPDAIIVEDWIDLPQLKKEEKK